MSRDYAALMIDLKRSRSYTMGEIEIRPCGFFYLRILLQISLCNLLTGQKRKLKNFDTW